MTFTIVATVASILIGLIGGYVVMEDIHNKRVEASTYFIGFVSILLFINAIFLVAIPVN